MKVLFRPAAVGAALLAALASPVACKKKDVPPAAAPAADAAAAVVDGETITMAALDHRLVEKMPADRVFEMRRQVLEEMVTERLLAREAKKRGISEQELTRTEIEAKVRPVGDGDIQELFFRSGLAARGATLEQYRARIEQSVRAQRTAERRAEFAGELRARSDVKVSLSEPRAQITIPADAPILGPMAAPVTVVEFLDYQCTYCQQVQSTVEQVLNHYKGKVRFVHRDFPLDEIHPEARNAARAARCAGEQGKFWQYHRRLLVEKGHDEQNLRLKAAAEGLDDAKFASCLASTRYDAAIEQALTQGRELGVSGTPTFFVNGRRMVGIRSLEELSKIIEDELKRVG